MPRSKRKRPRNEDSTQARPAQKLRGRSKGERATRYVYHQYVKRTPQATQQGNPSQPTARGGRAYNVGKANRGGTRTATERGTTNTATGATFRLQNYCNMLKSTPPTRTKCSGECIFKISRGGKRHGVNKITSKNGESIADVNLRRFC